MKKMNFTALPAYLLVALSATGYTASTPAYAAGECRQEAIDYGISPELVDDYVNGCMASRGELTTDEAVDMEYMPPVEAQDDQDMQEDLVTDDDDAAQ